MAKCITNRRHGEAVARGLCQGCYASAWRRIREGETTWERLVASGLALAVTIRRTKRTEFNRKFDRDKSAAK